MVSSFFDGNYRPDLKGLRRRGGGGKEFVHYLDGNYRPDLKGLRPLVCSGDGQSPDRDGNYRPDLKGLRHQEQIIPEFPRKRWKLPT